MPCSVFLLFKRYMRIFYQNENEVRGWNGTRKTYAECVEELHRRFPDPDPKVVPLFPKRVSC